MYVLFEEEGMFKTGHIMSESDAALQVEPQRRLAVGDDREQQRMLEG